MPVRTWVSYSSGGSSGSAGSAWARPHALLADVQKVLRHARKLPDKTQHLYKVPCLYSCVSFETVVVNLRLVGLLLTAIITVILLKDITNSA